MTKPNDFSRTLKKLLMAAGLLSFSSILWAKNLTEQQVKAVIDQQFKPLLTQYKVPEWQ